MPTLVLMLMSSSDVLIVYFLLKQDVAFDFCVVFSYLYDGLGHPWSMSAHSISIALDQHCAGVSSSFFFLLFLLFLFLLYYESLLWL